MSKLLSPSNPTPLPSDEDHVTVSPHVLLQPKPGIALGRYLRPLSPHDWSAVRTAEQEPGFAGNVRPHKPGVGLGPEQGGAHLGDVRPPGLFRLGRGLNV